MTTKNITLKVDSKIYDTYRKYCKKEGIIASRQFEKLMEKELKKYSLEVV
ncbi:MAG: RepB family protein [archaeon]